VDITADLDRSLKLEKDGLRDENLAGLCAQITDLGFQELNLFARSAASNLQQSIDDGIEIYIVLVRHGFCPLVGKKETGLCVGASAVYVGWGMKNFVDSNPLLGGL